MFIGSQQQTNSETACYGNSINISERHRGLHQAFHGGCSRRHNNKQWGAPVTFSDAPAPQNKSIAIKVGLTAHMLTPFADNATCHLSNFVTNFLRAPFIRENSGPVALSVFS
ncbi:unnamed protein product [Colias eurytheme]|nr:unnamed protein product [Colias eurytheme]